MGKTKDQELPKGQRLIGRPSLEKLFERDEKKKVIRDRIGEAVKKHRYSQMEVATYLKLHYSTISRLIKGVNDDQR